LPPFVNVTVCAALAAPTSWAGKIRLAGEKPAVGMIIVVGSVAVLLEVFPSPPPDTVAVLVTPPTALLPTFTVSVIDG